MSIKSNRIDWEDINIKAGVAFAIVLVAACARIYWATVVVMNFNHAKNATTFAKITTLR